MEAKEIRDMEDGELVKTIATLRKDLLGMRVANATGELENTAGLGRARRELARTLTVARERALAAERDQRGWETIREEYETDRHG
jgi:large subunit ribosomal protein L29